MKPERCPMAPLVEARRDGRLRSREDESLDRHLATCSSCAALAADLGRITTLLRAERRRASPLERQRGRMRLLRDAALEPERRPSRWDRERLQTPARLARSTRLLGAAALAALVVIALSALLRAPPPSPSLASVATPAPMSSARRMTELAPDRGARFSRSASGGVEVVTLEDGGVTFSVRRQETDERFLVKTADAEVEVRGTVFRVEAAGTRIRAVLVTEGKVLVRFRGTTTVLEGGEAWSPPPDPPSEDTAIAPTPTPRSPEPREIQGAAPARRPFAPRETASAKPEGEGPAKDFAEGVRSLERGDYGAAADKLEAFAAAHPEDGSAEDAAFLAILSLQRAGRVSDAKAAAKRYLGRYPHGYRRAEAEQILAGAERAAGH